MDAKEITRRICAGVLNALDTKRLLFGIEGDSTNNPELRPEYITTIEVAKSLTDIDHDVCVEAPMKDLRAIALIFSMLNEQPGEVREEIRAKYLFGKKDSKRLDVLVMPGGVTGLPLLMVEAKLSVGNFSGIKKDIDRLIRIFDMFSEVGAFKPGRTLYAAAVFHEWIEGSDGGRASEAGARTVADIKSYLCTVQHGRPWLYTNAALLDTAALIVPAVTYVESYPDDTYEEVLTRKSLTFLPGLVLMGISPDVSDAF
ncbi:hypothetical protein KPL74_17420 [Bacillus sp. NP157]|nr:hypothetical protein KPL74_17420 [Bacillus sp. NP157]